MMTEQYCKNIIFMREQQLTTLFMLASSTLFMLVIQPNLSWNKHVNNSEHDCSINADFPTAMNNLVTSSLPNNIVETILNNIIGPTMLLTHDNNVVQALFRQQPCDNLCV